MALTEEFTKTGNWLFTKRSYLPLVLYLLATVVIYYDRNIFWDFRDVWVSAVCLGVSLFGLFIRIMIIGFVPKGTFGRNVKNQVADSLNTKGVYSVVRHPLYLGNFFLWLGLIMYVGAAWFVLAVCLVFWIYYERIMFAEEAFLRGKFGRIYEEWASRTPAFIPNLKLWESAELSFSVKSVLKREYYGLAAMAFSFAYINAAKYYIYFGSVRMDIFWQVVFFGSLLIFVVFRFLKKKTKVFEVQDR